MQELRYIFVFLVVFSFCSQSQALRRIKRGSPAAHNRTTHHALIHEAAGSGGETKHSNAEQHTWARKAVAAVENAIDKALTSLSHHGVAENKTKKSALPMHSQLQYTNTGVQLVATDSSGQSQQSSKLTGQSNDKELHKSSLAYLLRDKRGMSERHFDDMQREGEYAMANGIAGSGGAAEVLIIDNGLPTIMTPEHGFNGAFQFHTPSLRSIANNFKKLAASEHNANSANNAHGNANLHSNKNDYSDSNNNNNNMMAAATAKRQQSDNDLNASSGKGNAATVAILQTHKRNGNNNNNNKDNSNNNGKSTVNDPSNNNSKSNAQMTVSHSDIAGNEDNKNVAFTSNNGYVTTRGASNEKVKKQQQQQQHESHDELLKKSISALLRAQGLPTLEEQPHQQQQRQLDLNKRQEHGTLNNNNNNAQQQPTQQQEEHQNHSNMGQCSAAPQKQQQLQQSQLQMQSPAQILQLGHYNGKMSPMESMLKFANMLLYKVSADSPLHAQGAQVSINANPSASVITVGPAIETTADDMDALDYLYNTLEPKAALLRAPLPAAAPLAPTFLNSAPPGSTALVARPFAMLPPYNMAEAAQPFNFIENALDVLLSAEDEGSDDEMEIRCPIHHEAKKKATSEGNAGEGNKVVIDGNAEQEGKNVIQVCSCRFLRKKKNNI